MRCLYVIVIFCVLGCKSQVLDLYERQIAELEKSLSNEAVTCFDSVDIWGRAWVLEEKSSRNVSVRTDDVMRWRSHGERLSDKSDDIKVFVHWHYEGGELLSWGYSYSYQSHGRINSGGCEFD